MRIGCRELEEEKLAYIMGILNVTPDSFSDGGKYHTRTTAMERARVIIAEGADMIDIGGESTRPGYEAVSEEEEMERVLPVIELIRKESEIPISVDTTKSEVAKAAIEMGADMINDISCLKDPNMVQVLSEYKSSYCLMHNRENKDYSNLMNDLWKDCEVALEQLKKAGISEESIVIDPGIGFAKTYEQNVMVLNQIEQLTKKKYPLLLGVSRKSVIGNALQLPIDERMEGTLAITIYGAMKGCRIFRVHDVKENVRALKMLQTILQAR